MAKDYKFNKDEQIKCPICGESANYREFPDVVRLLESKKYRQMWEELKGVVRGYKSVNQKLIMKNIEEKYLKEAIT